MNKQGKNRFLSSYWGNVGTVLGGMITAQTIPIIASLVITRIYVPTEFGIYSIWLGVVSIFSVVITGRLEHALGIEETGIARNKSTIAAAILAACTGAAFGVILIFAYYFKPAWFVGMSLPMLGMIIPTSFFLAISQLWQSLSACDGKFRQLSTIRITSASSVAILQIIAGELRPSALSLSFAHSLGAFIGMGVCFFTIPIFGVFPRSIDEALQDVKQLLVRHKKFPQFSLPADGINTLSGYLPLFILGSRFGGEIAGFVALALRIFGAPIALLGGAVRDVFKNSSSEAFQERGECQKEYIRTFKVLTICSLLVVPSFMLVSEWLFVVAFGENWHQAGVICAWLAPMFAMRFIASPLSYTMYIAERQDYDFVWQVALLLMALTVFTFATSYKLALIFYSFCYSALYGVYCWMSYKFSKGRY